MCVCGGGGGGGRGVGWLLFSFFLPFLFSFFLSFFFFLFFFLSFSFLACFFFLFLSALLSFFSSLEYIILASNAYTVACWTRVAGYRTRHDKDNPIPFYKYIKGFGILARYLERATQENNGKDLKRLVTRERRF